MFVKYFSSGWGMSVVKMQQGAEFTSAIATGQIHTVDVMLATNGQRRGQVTWAHFVY